MNKKQTPVYNIFKTELIHWTENERHTALTTLPEEGQDRL